MSLDRRLRDDLARLARGADVPSEDVLDRVHTRGRRRVLVRRAAAATSSVAILAALVATPAILQRARTEPLAVAPDVRPPPAGSIPAGVLGAPAASADGRFIAYDSGQPELLGTTAPACGASAAGRCHDVFVRDTRMHTTTRVSVSSAGVAGNGVSSRPSMSSDGRYVVFQSTATNLVADDTNRAPDVFVRDLVGGTTTRISLGAAGRQADRGATGGVISADGRTVAFESASANIARGVAGGTPHIYVRNLVTGATVLASASDAGAPANADSSSPSLSADGRLVAFESSASNIAPGADGRRIAFVRDLAARSTIVVSKLATGEVTTGFSPVLSAGGERVAFHSITSPASGVRRETLFVGDLAAQTTFAVATSCRTKDAGDTCWRGAAFSSDGNLIAFASNVAFSAKDRNATWDVFVRDLRTGGTNRVSVTNGEAVANGPSVLPDISGDGRYVAFASAAPNLSGDRSACRNEDSSLSPCQVVLRYVPDGITGRISVP
jgi:Tol biopolymer transport system component